MSGHDNSPTKALADSISSTSTEKDNDRLPARLTEDAEVITTRGNVITKDGVERLFVPGNELPRFWEGKEVYGNAPEKPLPAAEPMAVEV